MKIRLYLDEDALPRGLVRALRLRGVDVATAFEEGLIHQADDIHLAYAALLGRVLYSFNVGDYLALHSAYLTQGQHHAGLILGPQQQYSIGEQMRRLLKIVGRRSAEEMRDHVEFLGAWG